MRKAEKNGIGRLMGLKIQRPADLARFLVPLHIAEPCKYAAFTFPVLFSDFSKVKQLKRGI